MTKKLAVLFLMIIIISLAFSVETKKSPYWIDLNLGGNEIYEKSFDLAFMGGFSRQVKGPYLISMHISFPVWTSDFVAACDLQGGRVFAYGPVRLCPAVGIGYAKVGDYYQIYNGVNDWYDEIKLKGTVTLPISCNLQCAITRHFGIQATYSYNINHIRSYYGLYGGIIFGSLR